MKNYVAPSMTEMFDKVEGVYAASGAVTPGPKKDTPEDKWDITTNFANHNSGSHSELVIRGIHSGIKSGTGLYMNFFIKDFKLLTVKDWGDLVVSNVHENGFTVFRKNFYNASDRFEFNLQITAKDSPHGGNKGAVGVTGTYCPCNVVCVGYHA